MKLKHLLLLLMTVVSFSTTRAADGSDFTFNDGVRYSQWVINSRLNSFSANTAKMGFATFKADGTQIDSRNDGGKKKLDYVPGLVAKGVIEATQYYSQFSWAAPWTKPWFLSVADYGNKWYNVSSAGGSLDDLNGVKLYFALSELAAGAFPDNTTCDNASTAIGNAVLGLKNHNTSCAIKSGTLAGDDVVGGWWHKKAYNNQMWLDGQYMGPALLAQIINNKKSTTNIGTDDWQIIIKQLDAVWKMCWNATDKLMYHAFEAYGGTGTGDDATTSHAETWAGLSASKLHSASYWGRACGWYFLALVDILHEMDNATVSSQNTYTADDYNRIKGYLTSLAEGLKARQDGDTGGWYQILDQDGTYSASEYNNGQTHTQTYNYIESSATAIFAAAYLKAINLGYLDGTVYGETAKKAYQCIVNNFFAADGKDGVHIFGSCRSAGLGSDKTDGTGVAGGKNFRDGSNAYYLLGSDVTAVKKSDNETEGKVLGAFLLAATEYEKLYQKDKLLFEKDLAPTYSLTSDKPSITLNAYGVDGVTYQWYSENGTPVTDATSSTFTPSASGKYYCKAQAGSNEITSRTTDVTVIEESEDNNGASDTGVLNVTENGQEFVLSQTNINANGFASVTHADKWVSRTVGGTSYMLYNMSSGRNITLKVKGCISFEVKVQNSSAGRTYKIDVTDNEGKSVVSKTITHNATGTDKLESSGVISSLSTSEPYTIVIGGGSASVYPYEIIFYTDDTGSSTGHTVTYNANGHGTAPTAKTGVTSLTQDMLDATPGTVDGWTFKGWYKEAACTTPATVIAELDGDITLYAKWESSDTNTTFGNGSLNGTTLTVDSYASTEAGNSKTIAVTLPAGAKATVTSGNATFADGVLTYTAPAAGQSMAIKLLVTAEAGNTAEYTINVSTKSAGGSGTSSTATISWLDMALNSHNATTIAGIVTPEQFSSYLTGKIGRVSGLEPGGYKNITTDGITTRYYRYTGFDTAENTDIYFEYSYVVSGAKFIPTKLTVDWAPSGSKGVGFKVYGVNSDNTTIELTADKIPSGGDNVYHKDVIDISGATESWKAIRIVPFGTNKSIILNNVVLEGTIDVFGLKFEEGKGTLTGRTLTVIHEPADAGTSCTIGIIPTDGVTCALGTLPAGVAASLNGNTLTYTAPAAGTGSISIPLIATTADGTSYEYTVLVSTRVAPSYTSQYTSNDNAWTPAVGGTIALSKLINYERDESRPVTITGGDAATLSADAQTLTAVKSGEITLSLPATDNYSAASMTIQVNIGTDVAKDGTNAYTVENKVYSDGLAVNRENITMTFGNDGFWRKVTDGNLWTQGQTNPSPAGGKIPTSGTYYKFRPTKNGTLKATVYIGKTDDGKLRPLYVSENGTAIEATAGSYTVGKGETPAATEAYQGDVTFPVKANTDYYVYVNGSKMRLLGFEFDPVFSSDNTATFSRGVLNGETLTVTHHKSEANSAQTITVTPAIGATCTSVSGPATLDGDVIRYTAPVVGASLADITLTVKAENGATKTYTIKVSTVGDVTTGNAIFSVSELDYFGVLGNNNRKIEKQSVTLTAVDGSEGNVQGQGNGSGAKVQKTAGFTITPKQGYLITKVTLVTSQNNRHFDATPAQAGDIVQDDKTYEYSFNCIGDPITFSNNSGNGIYVTRIIVEYEKSVGTGKTILAASFDKNELTFYEDDTEIPALPVLSVKIGDEVADAGLYTVTYTSSNPNVVAVDTNGKLTKVGAGSAVINAEITPKDVNTYVGSEAFYTVTVKPLDIPTVYAHDITVYNTAGMQPEPVVDVYVKDEAGRSISLPKDYYTLAYTQQSGDAILISDKTGKFILAGEAGNWTTGSAVVRVEFNPTDDARQQYHITDTYVDFNVHVLKAGDKFIPAIGGVSEARIQISDNTSERSFVTPVLYDGVDLSTGFTFKYTLRDDTKTGSKFQNAASDGSVTSKGDGYVTLLSGKTAGIVYIDITATPDENYKSLYNEVTKAIQVTVADLKCYNSVTITPSSITAKVGDVLQGFDIVVRDENDNIVSEDDYTMFWGSSAPGVVAIAGNRGAGVFKTMAAGQAIVRVFVTDKDGEYSDRKGECTVTVIDDGTFKVTPEKIAELTGDKYDSSKANYGITASKLKGLELSVSDGLSVVLGGWMFPNSVKGSHGTTTETLGVDQWGAPTSKYRKPLGFTHNIQKGDQKNARQEYGSNCQPESNCIYDKTLTEVNDGFKLMDPMFNVPCSGSYLAFYPKTTGTVTVYIRQNGVFDNQTKNGVTTCVYRPQRRVFVIDEMGNFVSSTPKLEYPTTWQDNGLDTDGTKYTCDILGNSSEETKIYDLAKNDVTITGDTDKEKVQNWVKNHFEGLKTFDIDPEKFQNGVYASNLANEITHNNAQRNHSGDRAAKGWCVLTAAPVSYKFNVKAGKTYYLYNFGSKLGLFGFTFRPTDFVVDEKTWSQTSETNSPEKTPDNHVAKVSIPDRTFPAGIWSACVLPFSMNRIQVNNVFGDCYDKNNLKGTQILYFDRVEGHKIYFRRHAYNTIVAGKPFLIKPTKEAVISSENMGTKFPYVTIEAETPQAEWGRTAGNTGGIGSIDTDYTWVSSYGSMTALPGDYYLNGNGDVSHCTEGHQIPIKGFRGYLKAKTKQAASKVLKLAYDSNVDGDGEATPIEGLVMDREGNLLEVPTSGVVYNLSGQVVTRDADKLYTLPAGIYIVNGKKYIVR